MPPRMHLSMIEPIGYHWSILNAEGSYELESCVEKRKDRLKSRISSDEVKQLDMPRKKYDGDDIIQDMLNAMDNKPEDAQERKRREGRLERSCKRLEELDYRVESDLRMFKKAVYEGEWTKYSGRYFIRNLESWDFNDLDTSKAKSLLRTFYRQMHGSIQWMTLFYVMDCVEKHSLCFKGLELYINDEGILDIQSAIKNDEPKEDSELAAAFIKWMYIIVFAEKVRTCHLLFNEGFKDWYAEKARFAYKHYYDEIYTTRPNFSPMTQILTEPMEHVIWSPSNEQYLESIAEYKEEFLKSNVYNLMKQSASDFVSTGRLS